MAEVFTGGYVPPDTPERRRRKVTRVAQAVILAHPGEPYTELVELVKQACASQRVFYNSTLVAEAVEKWHV